MLLVRKVVPYEKCPAVMREEIVFDESSILAAPALIL